MNSTLQDATNHFVRVMFVRGFIISTSLQRLKEQFLVTYSLPKSFLHKYPQRPPPCPSQPAWQHSQYPQRPLRRCLIPSLGPHSCARNNTSGILTSTSGSTMRDTIMLIFMFVGHFRIYRKQNMLSSAMIVGIQKCKVSQLSFQPSSFLFVHYNPS